MKQIKLYASLHGLLLIFSLAPIFSKLAGKQPLFSTLFIVCYGVSIAILGLYALIWQQIIKKLPLTAAYANRAVTVVWGMLWGRFIFGESITLLKVVGVCIIIAGIVLFAVTQGKEAKHDG